MRNDRVLLRARIAITGVTNNTPPTTAISRKIEPSITLAWQQGKDCTPMLERIPSETLHYFVQVRRTVTFFSCANFSERSQACTNSYAAFRPNATMTTKLETNMTSDSGSARAVSPFPPATPRRTRGFYALVATQFQGAFSDNLLRNLLLSIVIGMNLATGERESFVSLVTFLFSVPFIVFSMAGGWLADRFSKRQITIWTTVMEIGSMIVATAVVCMHARLLSLVALTLVATQAALFGPSKYGLIPELLPEKRLSWGNGVIELGTFLAIIAGTVTGAAMAEHYSGHEVYAGYTLLALAFIGLLSSFGIDRVPAAAPTKKFRINFLADLWQQIRIMRRDQPLFLAVLGNTYFWFLGSLLFSTIVVYGPDVLHIGQTKTGYLNATLALGIGLGSVAAGYLSNNKIEYGLIPLGSIGMTATGFALGIAHHGMLGSAVLLGL